MFYNEFCRNETKDRFPPSGSNCKAPPPGEGGRSILIKSIERLMKIRIYVKMQKVIIILYSPYSKSYQHSARDQSTLV